jgi:hypothetical protein
VRELKAIKARYAIMPLQASGRTIAIVQAPSVRRAVSSGLSVLPVRIELLSRNVAAAQSEASDAWPCIG